MTREDLDDLCRWLGPQSYKLKEKVRLIELYSGKHARLSKRVEQMGHIAIHLGLAWGQDLVEPGACDKLRKLFAYVEPEDAWVAWPCGPWGHWSRYNLSLGGEARAKILEKRRLGRAHLDLFHEVCFWQVTTRPPRHSSGENPKEVRRWKRTASTSWTRTGFSSPSAPMDSSTRTPKTSGSIAS